MSVNVRGASVCCSFTRKRITVLQQRLTSITFAYPRSYSMLAIACLQKEVPILFRLYFYLNAFFGLASIENFNKSS